jgi:hypothetical protein
VQPTHFSIGCSSATLSGRQRGNAKQRAQQEGHCKDEIVLEFHVTTAKVFGDVT